MGATQHPNHPQEGKDRCSHGQCAPRGQSQALWPGEHSPDAKEATWGLPVPSEAL